MSDPVWLPDVIRAAGVKCDIFPGAFDRGHGDFGAIWGPFMHHTGSFGETPRGIANKYLGQVLPRPSSANAVDTRLSDAVSLHEDAGGLGARPDVEHVLIGKDGPRVALTVGLPHTTDHVTDVVSIGANAEVTRVDAQRVIAAVPNVHTGRDLRPGMQLVGHAMRVVLLARDRELSVSDTRAALLPTESSAPDPALVRT